MSEAERYKVVGSDKYGRDNANEFVLTGCEDMSKYDAEVRAKSENYGSVDDYRPYFYRAVPKSKPLYKWEP